MSRIRICFSYDYSDLMEMEYSIKDLAKFGSFEISFQHVKDIKNIDVEDVRQLILTHGIEVSVVRVKQDKITVISRNIEVIADFLASIGATMLVIGHPIEGEDSLVEKLFDMLVDYGVTLSFTVTSEDDLKEQERLNEKYRSSYKYAISTRIIDDEEDLLDIMMEHIGDIGVIYASNIERNTMKKGIPIFDTRGIIDFKPLIKLLLELEYDGYFILEYEKSHRSEYLNDARSLLEYMTSPTISKSFKDLYTAA